MRPALTSTLHQKRDLRPKVLQIGSGALLRGLVDFVIDQGNDRGDFEGGVIIMTSTGSGRSKVLQDQNGLFTHRIEGMKDGQAIEKFVLNTSILSARSAQDDWQEVMAMMRERDLEIIVSNTTEVGIQYQKEDLNAIPPTSYPAKLTALLYERFQHHPDRPMIILPTELLVDNGNKLRDIVLQHVEDHQLGEAFQSWIETENLFSNTLVDRIVTGMPGTEKYEALSEELGYQDHMLTVSEVYYLWAIEGDERLENRLGFSKQDEGVVIAEDISPFRERKLRILNGSHTFMVGLAHLCGLKTVADCMEHPVFGAFMKQLIEEEIVPSLPDEVTGGQEFGQEVMDRFRNPFLHHKVLDITLQYTTKMKMRNAASILRYQEKCGTVPKLMALGTAAFLRFAKPTSESSGRFSGEWNGQPYALRDDKASYWAERYEKFDESDLQPWIRQSLEDIGLDDSDGMVSKVAEYYGRLGSENPVEVVESVL